MATDAPTSRPPDADAAAAAALTTTTSIPEAHSQGQEQQQAPPSPPLPPKPVALTPGPRAARLEEVFRDRLRHTLSKLSYNNVAACYPTIAARAPATLRAVQGQMVSLLGSRCEKEFARILEDRDVVRKLNELEALVGDAGRRRAEADFDGRAPPVP